jgi:hypothetical protein
MTTATVPETLADVLTKSDPNKLADALAQVNLGALLAPVEETLTLATVGTAITLSKPALVVCNCRVTDISGAAMARVGNFVVGDAAATPIEASATAPGVAKLSADGLTITFNATIKAALVRYIQRPGVALTAAFKRS